MSGDNKFELFQSDKDDAGKEVLNGPALEQLRTKAGVLGARPTGFVIRGLAGDKPRADLKRPWEAIRRHAKLEGVRLHDLCHTFASIGAGASLGLPIVGRLLGHSQPQTTDRYTHLDADPLRRAGNIIGDQLNAALRCGAGKTLDTPK